jgi:hypothetical protein
VFLVSAVYLIKPSKNKEKKQKKKENDVNNIHDNDGIQARQNNINN